MDHTRSCMLVTLEGTKIWHRMGILHREDGPAYEDCDGTKVWYRDGKIHRVDGPAIIRPNGDKEWWLNGKLFSRTADKCKCHKCKTA